MNLNEWKCLIFQYNTHTNNPNYSVNSVFCTCNAMLTLTSHDEQVHVYNQCQTQIYVELIAKQLLATQIKSTSENSRQQNACISSRINKINRMIVHHTWKNCFEVFWMFVVHLLLVSYPLNAFYLVALFI